MRVARRAFLASTLASLVAPAAVRPAWAIAPQITLKLHHSFSSMSCVHDKFLVPWARKFEVDSGGLIRVDIFPSMLLGGAPADLFDQARDGVADIVWAMPSQTPGRFPRIEAFELPFLPARRALVNSKALEDYGAKHLQDEFREVHPICFSCRDNAVLHTARPVRTIADLKRLKMHVGNRIAAAAVHALGAHGIPMPVPQIPMALAGHVIDGCLDPWDLAPRLKLDELLKAHTEMGEASLSTSTFALVMNKAAYERLPRELKAVIDSNSGQPAAGMAGAMWDAAAAVVAARAREQGGAVALLAPDEAKRWRRATARVIAAWTKQMKQRRIDGRALLASARGLLAKYANEPEPQRQQLATPPAAQAAVPPQQAPAAGATAIARPAAPPAPPPVPAANPAPAAAPKRKPLDIPL